MDLLFSVQGTPCTSSQWMFVYASVSLQGVNEAFIWSLSDNVNSGEKYSADDTKTKIIYVVGQWAYTILMILPAPIFFYFK